MEKLKKIQSELIAAKNKKNDFGKYSYRNIEAVLSELKPILDKYNCHLRMYNELVEVAGRAFIKTVATFVDIDTGYEETSQAFSAIDFDHKGMSSDQCTGAAITYCNKYTLNNLFLIDDGSNDPDSQKPKNYEDDKEEKKSSNQEGYKVASNFDFKDIDNATTKEELMECYNKIQTLGEKAKAAAMNKLKWKKNQLGLI